MGDGTISPDPLIELPGSDWRLWRSVILRGAGFPVDGLDRLRDVDCAAAADSLSAADFVGAYERAARAGAAELRAIAGDPRFREAVTWQSPTSVAALDGLVRTDPDRTRNNRQREREIAVTRYWQRYCAKNDTIGFFGPVAWARFDPDAPALRMAAGPDVDEAALIRTRVVDFEWRALTAFADRLAGDPRFRPWLPVLLQPHLALDLTPPPGQVRRVGAAPVPLTPAQAALLSVADGTRPAQEVVALALATPGSGLRRPADGFLLLDQLTEQGLLRPGLDLPFTLDAEAYLRSWLDRIGDPGLHDEAHKLFARLDAARAAVAGAAGDADALRCALAALDAEFSAVTDAPVRHRAGETYVGRGIVYEDTVRDVDVVLGGPVLEALARPLDVLLRSARWLTVAAAEAYTATLRELYHETAADLGTASVPVGDLWQAANSVMFGDPETDTVLGEFTRRWARLLGLADVPAGTRRVTRDAAALADAADRIFPAAAPAWTAGRVHSPDLHLCASGPEALRQGEFTVVLGELHVAWLTCDNATFTRFHPEPAALRQAAARDLGERLILLYPPDFPQLTARIAEGLIGRHDVRLAYTAAPVWTGAQVLPLAALTVSLVDGTLVAEAADGRRWPLVELFGPFLSAFAVNAYKLVAAGPHTPRVTVDRLVLQRETWRCTVVETGLAQLNGEAERYLAARRWRAARGLPERVFVRVGAEIKPCYVDFASPAYVAAFAAMVRAAYRSHGAAAEVVVSEMLPDPQDAWLTDAAGRRYSCELRITAVDPMPAPGARPVGTVIRQRASG